MIEAPRRRGEDRAAVPGVAAAAHDAAWLIGASYVAQILTLVLSIALRRQLGPEDVGFVALVQLVATYAPFVSLGVAQAAEREIAIELGRGAESTARDLELTQAAVAIGLAAIGAAGVVAFVVLGPDDSTQAAMLVAAAAVVLVHQLGVWATIRLRTRQLFRPLALWGAVGLVAVALGTLIGAFAGGVSGALAGLAGGSAVQAILLALAARLRSKPAIHTPSLRRLRGLAPSFLAAGLSAILLASIDQIAVAGLLGAGALGLYSTAYLGNLFLMRVPNLVGSVLYPRLQRDLGANANHLRVEAMSRRTTGVMVVAMPPLIAVLFVGLPILIRFVLPAFEASVPPMRLLLVGVAGLAFAIPGTQLLITINRQWRQVAIALAFAGGMAVAYLLAAAAGWLSIDLAAGVDLVAYVAYGLTVQVVAARAVAASGRWLGWAAIVLLVPLVVLLAGGLAADLAREAGAGPTTAGDVPLMTDIAIGLGQLVIFAAAWVLVVGLAVRRDRVLRADLAAIAAAATPWRWRRATPPPG